MKQSLKIVLICTITFIVSIYIYANNTYNLSDETYIETSVTISNVTVSDQNKTAISITLNEGDKIKINCYYCFNMLSDFLELTLENHHTNQKIDVQNDWNMISDGGEYKLVIEAEAFMKIPEISLLIQSESYNFWETSNLYTENIYLTQGEPVIFSMFTLDNDKLDVRLEAAGSTSKEGIEMLASEQSYSFEYLSPSIAIRPNTEISLTFSVKEGISTDDYYSIQFLYTKDEVNEGGGGSGGGESVEEEGSEEEEEDGMSPEEMVEMFKLLNSEPPKVSKNGSDSMEIVVPARRNIIKGSRVCVPIPIVLETHVWAYWIGVENGLKDELKKDIPTLLDRYVESKFVDSTSRDVFPRTSFDDDIEYAIVDQNNKELFETTTDRWKARSSSKGKRLSSVHGILRTPREELYLCLCNDNEYSDVVVHFAHGSYDIQK